MNGQVNEAHSLLSRQPQSPGRVSFALCFEILKKHHFHGNKAYRSATLQGQILSCHTDSALAPEKILNYLQCPWSGSLSTGRPEEWACHGRIPQRTSPRGSSWADRPCWGFHGNNTRLMGCQGDGAILLRLHGTGPHRATELKRC